jgi:hypothetical protein
MVKGVAAHFKSNQRPPSKRMKPELEPVSPKDEIEELVFEPEIDVYDEHCTICLQSFVDRTLVLTCSHEFCFECLMIWSGMYPFNSYHRLGFLNSSKQKKKSYADQSRRCPLCARDIGEYLIHSIRSSFDYQKHFLPPLRTSPRHLPLTDGARIAPIRRRRERVWGRRDRAAQDEADALERAVSRRRWIYQHNLYAKVI